VSQKLHVVACPVQVALVICGLFICEFAYMRMKNGLFSGTYPLIYSDLWSFYMRIHYVRAYFWSPYLSHITRSTCTVKPVYNGAPGNPKIVSVVDGCSLVRGTLCFKSSKWDFKNVVGKWSLAQI